MEFCHRPLYNRTEDVKTSIGNSLLFIPCVLIIAGNLMMLIIVLKHKEFGNKSTTNYLIASLAISDLIVGALVIPTAVAEHIAGNWIFGHFWCAVWQYIDATVLVATILTLCAISLDRYWAISDPFRYTQTVTKKHIFIVLTLIWTLSILLIAPPFLLKHRPEYVCTKVSCKCRAILVNQSYAIFGTIVTFIIPLIIITFANYRTYRIGMKQISAVYHEYVPSSSDGGKPRTYIVLKKQLKLTKSTGTVIGAFLICWSPLFISFLAQSICNRCLPCLISVISVWLAWLNSALNPIIFASVSKKFRRSMCSLLRLE